MYTRVSVYGDFLKQTVEVRVCVCVCVCVYVYVYVDMLCTRACLCIGGFLCVRVYACRFMYTNLCMRL